MPTPGNICPLTGYIGAEVTGVDLGKLDDAGAKTVWDTFLEHQVVFFRHQTLSPDELLELGQAVWRDCHAARRLEQAARTPRRYAGGNKRR